MAIVHTIRTWPKRIGTSWTIIRLLGPCLLWEKDVYDTWSHISPQLRNVIKNANVFLCFLNEFRTGRALNRSWWRNVWRSRTRWILWQRWVFLSHPSSAIIHSVSLKAPQPPRALTAIGGLSTRISMTTILTNECGVGGGPARPIHQSAGRLSSSRSLHSLVQPSMGKPHVIIRSRRRCAVDLVSGTHSMWPHDFPCAITHPFVWPPGPAQHVAATDPIIDQGV